MGETTSEVRRVGELNRSEVGSSRERSPESHDNTDTDQEVTQIRSGIEQTRASLSETIDALQEKLDPARIAEQVKDHIREKATEAYDTAKTAVVGATIEKAGKIVSNVSDAVTDMTGRAGTAVRDSSVIQYIRENPIPIALVGIGFGMLAMSQKKKTAVPYNYSRPGGGLSSQTESSSLPGRAQALVSGVADSARGVAERATSAVTSAAGTVREAASSAADTTRQQFSNVSGQAQQGVRVAGDQFQTLLQDNPMALGIAALAAGALVGMSLPSTRVEGQYMGEARDRLVGQAKSMAQEAVEKVQQVAGEAGRSLKDVAQKQGLVSQTEQPTTA